MFCSLQHTGLSRLLSSLFDIFYAIEKGTDILISILFVHRQCVEIQLICEYSLGSDSLTRLTY